MTGETQLQHPAMAPSVDPGIAQRSAADPQASVWVAASAGTGKTRVLTDRVLRLLLSGTTPERILCLTFTKAAASEMANRINEVLAFWATADDGDLDGSIQRLTGMPADVAVRQTARQLFARVLDTPGGMKIQTIHAFCQSLLRRFPIEAGISPHFEPADERSVADILRQASDVLLTDTDPVVTDALSTASALTDENGFLTLMASIVGHRARLAAVFDAAGSLEEAFRLLAYRLGVDADQDEQGVIEAAVAEESFDAEGLRRVIQALERAGSQAERTKAVAMAAFLAEPSGRSAKFALWCSFFLTKTGSIRSRLATKAVVAACPAAVDILKAEAQRLIRVHETLRSVRLHAASRAFLTLGHALLATYRRLKQARGLLDFDDLILTTGALLTRPGVAPWVLFKLDGGLDHILIDEAQDTSPDQWRVIAALADEFFAGEGAARQRPGMDRTVFAVGDEKQSIYSFQGADVAEFSRMRRFFTDRVQSANRHFRSIDLQVSFRSTSTVLDFVNSVFADPEARDGLSEEGGQVPRHVAFRAGEAGLVEVWPLVEKKAQPDFSGWEPLRERIAMPSPARQVAGAIADAIRTWIRDRRPLAAKGRPVSPGDILILVRTRGPFFHDIVRALKEAGVPVAGADRMVLSQQMAIMDLLALARFALLSRDDLTLAGLLKSPFIGLTDDDLIMLAPGRPGSLWDELTGRAQEHAHWAKARAWLGDILARVDYLTPFGLFSRVLDHPCPADAVSGRRALMGRLGREAEDPLDEFLALSLAYEARFPPSLQGFLAWLDSEESDIKREQGGDAGVVRVMTVHGAKGLQAPIVFLPDTTGRPRKGQPIHWVDSQALEQTPVTLPLWAPNADLKADILTDVEARYNQAQMREYRRLLYVALTRAEDELYICGFSNGQTVPEESWYRMCAKAADQWPPSACFDLPWLRGDEGPFKARRKVDGAVPAPAHHQAKAIGEENGGATASRTGSDRDEGNGDGAGRVETWMFEPAPAEPYPPRPLSPSKPEIDEPAVRSPIDRGRSGDHFQRGRIIHTLLQVLPEVPVEGRRQAAERYLASRSLGLSADRQRAYRDEVLDVLTHPDFAEAFAEDSRAEVPVVGRIGRERPFILSGQIDRLAIRPDSVLIVDYKTNRPVPSRIEGVSEYYIMQLAAYRAALGRIYPDRPIRCALLWTDTPLWMPIPSAMLDRWYQG